MSRTPDLPSNSQLEQPQSVDYSLPDGSHIQLNVMKHPDSSKPADWRDENQIPDTNGIKEMREDLKRARAESSVSVAGQAKYPYLISPVINWPDGVKALAVIQRARDLEMLNQMFST